MQQAGTQEQPYQDVQEHTYDDWLQRVQDKTVDVTAVQIDGRGFNDTDRAYTSQTDVETLVEAYFASDDQITYREAWIPDELAGHLIAENDDTGERIVLRYDARPQPTDQKW